MAKTNIKINISIIANADGNTEIKGSFNMKHTFVERAFFPGPGQTFDETKLKSEEKTNETNVDLEMILDKDLKANSDKIFEALNSINNLRHQFN
jgi:hypothetical protein